MAPQSFLVSHMVWWTVLRTQYIFFNEISSQRAQALLTKLSGEDRWLHLGSLTCRLYVCQVYKTRRLGSQVYNTRIQTWFQSKLPSLGFHWSQQFTLGRSKFTLSLTSQSCSNLGPKEKYWVAQSSFRFFCSMDFLSNPRKSRVSVFNGWVER